MQHLDVDPEREHIQPADLDPLPPVRRCAGIQVISVETLQPDGVDFAEEIVREHAFHDAISAHPERGRAKHRDLVWKTARRRQHLLGLGAIVRQPRLTKNMLARLERRNGDGGMHVRRRADPDDIDIGQRDEIGPVSHRHRAGHIFAAKIFRAFVGGIRDRDDLDIGAFAQRRQVTIPPAPMIPIRSLPFRFMWKTF